MRAATGKPIARSRDRGQSSVVGVALLLGATVIALGVLTASVGTIVDNQASRADADRVATDLDEALKPVETTGHRTGEVRFADGSLYTVERDLHVLENGTPVRSVEIGGLVFESGDRRVRSIAGAVVRGRDEAAWAVTNPPVVGSERNGVLVVGAAKLNASQQSVGGSQVTARLSTNVSHDRETLGPGTYAVAIETRAPAAVEAALRDRGATSIDRRDVDGDGLESVVGEFPGTRTAYLVKHDMRLEVANG